MYTYVSKHMKTIDFATQNTRVSRKRAVLSLVDAAIGTLALFAFMTLAGGLLFLIG